MLNCENCLWKDKAVEGCYCYLFFTKPWTCDRYRDNNEKTFEKVY
jgi:hypothetical protein